MAVIFNPIRFIVVKSWVFRWRHYGVGVEYSTHPKKKDILCFLSKANHPDSHVFWRVWVFIKAWSFYFARFKKSSGLYYGGMSW